MNGEHFDYRENYLEYSTNGKELRNLPKEEEDPKLLIWYDQAGIRMGGE